MEYTLFLDECDYNINWGFTCFCLCGCIIENNVYPGIESDFNKIKDEIFEGSLTKALHEYEVKQKKKFPYTLLKDDEKEKQFWERLSNLLKDSDLKIIGAVIDVKEYNNMYPDHGKVKNVYYIVMQMVMECFAYFLDKNNATGKIIAENRNDSPKLLSHYYSIMANGTLYLDKRLMQDKIKGIEFKDKADNICGLQLSDFIANPINRDCSKMEQHRFSILPVINQKLYDGDCKDKKRFGIRQLLCTNP